MQATYLFQQRKEKLFLTHANVADLQAKILFGSEVSSNVVNRNLPKKQFRD